MSLKEIDDFKEKINTDISLFDNNYKSKYFAMSVICIFLVIIISIGFKNKINMNFSKKSNKMVVFSFIACILYIYQMHVNKFYSEIKKDLNKPGDGIIGKNINLIKDDIDNTISSGYLGNTLSNLKEHTLSMERPLEYTYEVDSVFIQQLKNNNAIGYIVTNRNEFYIIKTTFNNKYILEGKLNRNDMTKNIISIDENNKIYQELYLNIKKVEIFDKSLDSTSILI
jgi:energy-coupling factor transporter transmembrane protein EcfT